MRCAAAIVAWNGQDMLGPCLASLVEQSEPPAAVVVLDNASVDSTSAVARRFIEPARARGIQLSVIRPPRNLGFTLGANAAMGALLKGQPAPDVVLLLNQDVCVAPEWCAQIQSAFSSQPRAGIVGSLLLYPDGATVQHAGGYLERPRLLGRHFDHHAPRPVGPQTPRQVEFVTGAAMAIRADALRSVGLFAEIFSPGYYEDVDLCDRIRAADWSVWYWPDAVGTHAESTSFSRRQDRFRLSHRNRLVYAIRDLGDRRVRTEFLEAEAAYLRAATDLDELVALAAAYRWFVLGLNDALAARRPGRQNAVLHGQLADAFADLGRSAMASLLVGC